MRLIKLLSICLASLMLLSACSVQGNVQVPKYTPEPASEEPSQMEEEPTSEKTQKKSSEEASSFIPPWSRNPITRVPSLTLPTEEPTYTKETESSEVKPTEKPSSEKKHDSKKDEDSDEDEKIEFKPIENKDDDENKGTIMDDTRVQAQRHLIVGKLIDALQKANPDKNIVISDYSINMALSMLLEGVESDTREELEKFLGITKDSSAEYNKNLIEQSKESQETIVEIANALWYSPDVTIKKEFIERLEEYFAATAKEIDFDDDSATSTINMWCSDKTHGLIKEIVSPESLEDVLSMLVNVIYFKGNWINKFNESLNTEETFKGTSGDSTVTMMHSTETTYLENDNAIGFMKPYYDGYKFVGILPKDDDVQFAKINIDDLIESATTDYDVKIGLPKFKTEYSTELNDALKALGISSLFTAKADFSGMSNDNLEVSKVLHKTFISVDELGTEAAAVTGVTVKLSSLPKQKEVKEVILDRPFAFAIIDSQNNTIFSGVISNI